MSAGPVSRHEYGPHRRQYAELWLPEGDRRPGVVVLVHGGFWRARWTCALQHPMAEDLVARGHVVWNLEYRCVGADGGWPESFDDVAAGIDALADVAAAHDLDLSSVTAIGHSAGGHLVAWAASRPQLPAGAPGAGPRVPVTLAIAQAGVVALSRAAREGVGDGAVLDLLGGGPDELPERYALADPTLLVPAPVPVVCMHARADANVPWSQSEAYVRAARDAGGEARLVEVPGDHFTLIDPTTPDWRAVLAEL